MIPHFFHISTKYQSLSQLMRVWYTAVVLKLQGVPKRCIHSLNRYNLIKLLIFAFK